MNITVIGIIANTISMLKQRILDLKEQHGSLRAAARVLGVTAGYLCRLRDGKKNNPSQALLRKMGLQRIVEIRYEHRVNDKAEKAKKEMGSDV